MINVPYSCCFNQGNLHFYKIVKSSIEKLYLRVDPTSVMNDLGTLHSWGAFRDHLLQTCSLFGPIFSNCLSMSQIGPNVVPTWTQNHPEVAQGPKINPKPFQICPILVPKLPRTCVGMVQKCIPKCPKLFAKLL